MNVVTIIASPKTEHLVLERLRFRKECVVTSYTSLADAKYHILATAVDVIIAEHEENLYSDVRALSPSAACIVLVDTKLELNAKSEDAKFRMLTTNIIPQKLLSVVDQALKNSLA